MQHSRLSIPISGRPRFYRSGEAAIPIPMHLVEKDDEIAVGLQFICNRPLFGACYLRLTSDYFWAMPYGSGVFVSPFVPSDLILPEMLFPGDIDLLVVPYEGDQLIISRTLAIELKVIRASYERQGKSPNRFGFSQALSLLDHGFPRAAVIHLYTSDESPESAWRDVEIARIVDADSGRVELEGTVKADLMPVDLITRGFGRLKSNRPDSRIGVVSAYFADGSRWEPMGARYESNPNGSVEVMEAVGSYFQTSFKRFMDIPRHDPRPEEHRAA